MRGRLALLAWALAAPAVAQVPMGPEIQVNSYTTTSWVPALASAPDGRSLVVWHRFFEGTVFARRLDADLQPQGPEFQVSTTAVTDQLPFHGPSVGVSSQGFVVIWDNKGVDGSGFGVVGQRFDTTGARLGVEFRVNTQTYGDQGESSVAVREDGAFVVVWKNAAQHINGQRFDPLGAPLGGEFLVNAPTFFIQYNPHVAMDGMGNFTVVYNDSREQFHCLIHGRRFDASGGVMGDDFQVNTSTTVDCEGPQIAIAPGGRSVVSWPAYGDGSTLGVFAQIYDAAGAAIGTEFQVNSYTTDLQWRQSVAIDDDGRFFVAWQGRSPRYESTVDVIARPFDAAGQADGPEFVVSGGLASFADVVPKVAADAIGNMTVAWLRPKATPVAQPVTVAARRYFGGVIPAALAVDPTPSSGSDGNGVLEACETVTMRPSWRNVTAAALALQGTLSGLTGPAGASYTLVDGNGSYGTVGSGSTQSCIDCYSVGVSCASPRPVQHWDATVLETLGPVGQKRRWPLHIGDSFADVPRSNPFYRHVEALLHQSVTAGCAAGLYCPAASVTREQMAAFAITAKEGSAYQRFGCALVFGDVPPSSPFCFFINELARRGVVSGCGGGNYCPTAPVTREQMAVFVLRTLDPALNPPACTTPVFADVPASSPFCRWIEELARRGVVSGCGGGNYCPAAPVTREQMAVFLSGTFGLTLYGPIP